MRQVQRFHDRYNFVTREISIHDNIVKFGQNLEIKRICLRISAFRIEWKMSCLPLKLEFEYGGVPWSFYSPGDNLEFIFESFRCLPVGDLDGKKFILSCIPVGHSIGRG